MNYQVHITKTAEHDIAKAADYIEFVLKNPQAADHLLDVATEKIGELTQMPEMCIRDRALILQCFTASA